MALTIRLASAFLVSALAAGCNQSLFDANLGGDDPAGDGGNTDPDGGDGRDSGGRDGAPPIRPDARVTDAGRIDIPDARIPGICPEPCAGDAYADFDGTSGGSNGLWRYVEVNASYQAVAMSSASYPGAAGGWIGMANPASGIAYCTVSGDQLPCGDQDNTLVFIIPATAPTNPGVGWTAPMPGDYQLTVDWTFPSTAPTTSNLFYIIRGASAPYEFSTDARPGTFAAMITLAQGETVTLTAFADTSTSTSLAVNFYITGPLTPAGFQGVQP
jgi:hypothetical protein